MGETTRRPRRQAGGQCARMACGIAIVLSLSACDSSEYPKDWPGHAYGLFSRKGGCPDLAGEYDGVDQRFVALFFGGDPLEKREHYVEHKATITEADDGASLAIDLAINERGMDQLEAGKGGGNVWGGYRHIVRRRNADYRCSGGWMMFDDMQLGRDRSGGLIAHRTVAQPGSIGWGDVSLSTGTHLRNLWLRLPARDPARDVALASRGHFVLRRADWTNDGRSTPVYLTSYFARPLCIRYVHRYAPWPDAIETSAIGRVGDPARLGPLDCPAGWARLESGETQLQEMNVPDNDGEYYRYEWFRFGEPPASARVIEINDAATLPHGEGLLGTMRIGQESLRVN